MNAHQIVSLLKEKHSDDVFVPECKDGPTQFVGGHIRLDAWAMARSWSNPVTYGYEVKVSRSDFLRDEKWRSYLSLCSKFSFVCPNGLIRPDELPQEAGLLWVTKTGGKLITKKPAPLRNVQIPESLFRYVLMCRTSIKQETLDKASYWKSWLAQTEEEQRQGHEVEARLAKLTRERSREVESIDRLLKSRETRIKELEDAFARAGVSISSWNKDAEAARYKERIEKAIKHEDIEALRRSHEAIGKAISILSTDENQNKKAEQEA